MARRTRVLAVRTIAVAVILAGGLAVAGGTAAGADPPTITIDPSHLPARGTTHVRMSGFPAGPGTIALCANTPVPPSNPSSECLTLATYPSGLPSEVDVVVPYQMPGRPCGDFGEGPICALAAYVVTGPGPPPTVQLAATPIVVDPPPVAVTPNRNLADPATVTLTASGITPGPTNVFQCPRTRIGNGTDQSAAPVAVTVDADGRLSTSLVLHRSFLADDAVQRTCDAGCTLLLETADGPVRYEVPISFGPPAVLLDDNDATGRATVGAQLSGFPGTTATFAQCVAPVGATQAASRCNPASVGTAPLDTAGNGPVEPGGDGQAAVTAAPTFTAGGTAVDCRIALCAVAGFDAVGATVAWTPLVYQAGPSELTLAPWSGLHDGETIHATVARSPAFGFRFVHCVRGTGSINSRCEKPLPNTITTSNEADVPAFQRFTTGSFYSRQYCRLNCSIAVIEEASGAIVAEAPYLMATPKVSASPSSGLSGGQTVTVTGSDLQPTYAGPTVLFPTGGWALTVCDSHVGSSPSLVDVFQQCAIPPGFGGVGVPGTTVSRSVQVPATITKILGGATDCTASPGACVVGLTRWEQDASVSAAFTPLSFG